MGLDYTRDLHARIVKLHISAYVLAREADMEPTQLSRMFRNNTVPRFETVLRLENALDRILQERAKKKT